MKRQARDLEKIFANQISNKALISGTYRGLSRFNSIKKNQKMNRRQEETFVEEEICITNKHMKRCFTLAIKEM